MENYERIQDANKTSEARKQNYITPAKLHKSEIFQCSYSCELQTKYIKGNKCKIYIEITKYAIYAKFAQLNSVFCLDFEFFHTFSPSRITQSLPTFNWY